MVAESMDLDGLQSKLIETSGIAWATLVALNAGFSGMTAAASALGGSVIGGLISGVAAVASQRVQARANILANEITRREDLYKDFIMAASTALRRCLADQRAQGRQAR